MCKIIDILHWSTLIVPGCPTGRHKHIMEVQSSTIIIFGGCGSTGLSKSSVDQLIVQPSTFSRLLYSPDHCTPMDRPPPHATTELLKSLVSGIPHPPTQHKITSPRDAKKTTATHGPRSTEMENIKELGDGKESEKKSGMTSPRNAEVTSSVKKL